MVSDILDKISKDLLCSRDVLLRMYHRAPHAYKFYDIPKKNGGIRRIAQPAREVKKVQRWVVDNILSSVKPSAFSTAYLEGSSIKKNACMHLHNAYIAKFDFKNFFYSIKFSDVKRTLEVKYGMEEGQSKFIARLCSVSIEGNLCLSIGAPSSPSLSNIVMYDFDEYLAGRCLSLDIVYTRYADDMTFSSNEKGVCFQIEGLIVDALRNTESPELALNHKKTNFISKKYRRTVTGLTLTNDKKSRISLGRDRKRLIKALVHRSIINKLDKEELEKLQGLLGFAYHNEFSFYNSLCDKYGFGVVSNLMKQKSPTIT